MKTNLDEFFKTDETMESEGIWCLLREGVGFRIKRFGGHNSTPVKKALAKYYKPFAHQVEKGTLDPKKEREIFTRVFVEACITDWKGIEIDGEAKPFSNADCVKLLVKFPDLYEVLEKFALDMTNYKEDLGNS